MTLSELAKRKYVAFAALFYVVSVLVLAWFRPPPLFYRNDDDTRSKVTPFGMRSKYASIFGFGVISMAIAAVAFIACVAFCAARGEIA